MDEFAIFAVQLAYALVASLLTRSARACLRARRELLRANTAQYSRQVCDERLATSGWREQYERAGQVGPGGSEGGPSGLNPRELWSTGGKVVVLPPPDSRLPNVIINGSDNVVRPSGEQVYALLACDTCPR